MTYFTVRVFISALTIFGTLALTSEFGYSQTQPASSSPIITTFRCVPLGDGFATVAQRGERTTSPIITWNSTAFGPTYTPQRRCEIVSNRLTQAVATNGGKMRNLRLTYGDVGSNPVICYINNPNEKCNSDNLLLTLNQSDRGKESQILQQLITFGIYGKGNPVHRGQSRTVVYLGIEVEKDLGAEGTVASPNSTTPVILPQHPAPAPVPSTAPSTAPATTPSAKPPVDNGL